MHPLMGLWAHSRKIPANAGHIVNVPSSYVVTSTDDVYLWVSLLTSDGAIIEVDLCDLVINNPLRLRERVDADPPPPVVAP